MPFLTAMSRFRLLISSESGEISGEDGSFTSWEVVSSNSWTCIDTVKRERERERKGRIPNYCY